jgi:hypothetical protein
VQGHCGGNHFLFPRVSRYSAQSQPTDKTLNVYKPPPELLLRPAATAALLTLRPSHLHPRPQPFARGDRQVKTTHARGGHVLDCEARRHRQETVPTCLRTHPRPLRATRIRQMQNRLRRAWSRTTHPILLFQIRHRKHDIREELAKTRHRLIQAGESQRRNKYLPHRRRPGRYGCRSVIGLLFARAFKG